MTTLTYESLTERLSQADCSWMSSTRPDGRAHSAPVWHIWYEDHIYVVTQETAVKVKNIAVHPHVVITHQDPVEPVIVEGTAVLVDGIGGELRPFFKQKYDWDIVTDKEYQTIIQIKPTKIIAWTRAGNESFRWHSSM